ncbi:hypothetical protein Trydic_g18890 [Trypoxylus dichotomus]
MAVFLLNNCTYPDCRKKFTNLSNLIYHIEEEHIDFSPAVIEEKERQKVQSIPLSYVLKYSQLYRPPEAKDNSTLLKKASVTPKIETEYILSEHATVLIESEISDDSWNDECTNNDLISYSRKSVDNDYISKEEYTSQAKKFVCPVPGCNKRYKNINGIKYHTKNSHEIKRNLVKPKKIHKCHCGRSYKTIQGLKAHFITHREVNVNFHKLNAASGSHLLTGQKLGHAVYPYIHQNNLHNNNFLNKPDIADEDMLPYSYLEQPSKLNGTPEYDQSTGGHFGFFTPPYSYGNSIATEGFSDSCTIEEAINQNY